MWEPLPLIVYGYAVHPLSPSRRDTRFSARNRLSTVTESSTEENLVHRDVVSLEVGDEVYAFEKYTPRAKEVEGIWYRGYVVCTTRRPPVTWSLASDPSSSAVIKPPAKTEEPHQVFIGIFPASHIYVRDEFSDAEGRLPDLAITLNGAANGYVSSSNGWASGHASHGTASPGSSFVHWNGNNKPGSTMGSLKEEDEDADLSASRKSFRTGPLPDLAKSLRTGIPGGFSGVYPASLNSSSVRSSSPADSQVMKPLPPRPSLKSGDETASGAAQPIIDEIASALREWHSFMFQYLARRDYKLFHIVREHIEALHLGRRQLLAQTLNAEETINMRRDCVTRLVSGNIVQGLDVIVRHPTWGGLVTVDVEGEIEPRSWVSAVRMYSMQTALAYLNISHPETLNYTIGSTPDYMTAGPLPTPAHSAFPESSYHKPRSLSLGSTNDSNRPATAKFFHIFLDLRAFVASPCAPGETAELFFSLYKRSGQFVTEDFCAILNHNGVLARDPTKRIRTLFTDLALSDVQDPIYLVCRIVRSGALKPNSGLESGRRGSEGFVGRSEPGWDGTPNSPRPAGTNDVPINFRRPFGCAVLELTHLARMAAEEADVTPAREHQMPIFTPTNEATFSMIHQNIISKNVKEYEKSPKADMLAVTMKIFRGDAPTIVRENTSLLQDTPHTLRLGFPDVVFPGDVRNELYIKLWSGEFSPPTTGGGRMSMAQFARGQMTGASNNVQVTVEVRDQDGRAVESVISQGSGEPLMTQFHSTVFQRCNEPTYGELIKVQLPPQGIPEWHLFFTFRNRSGRERGNNARASTDNSERPFAFAFQPLFPDKRAFVEDGSHTLILYRAEKMANITPDIYLTAPSWLAANQRPEQLIVHPEMMRVTPPIRDTLTLRSSLCSTKFTQNPVLLSLLSWERLADRELLSTVLTKFTFVGEGEIVKFLRDIFDSLFGILVSQNNQSGEMDELVFNALVTVLGIVQDRRFSNFQPVLDVYIEQHFNCAAASSHMIHSMTRLLANPTSTESASPLRAALKVWHYIFKFIARSRDLQKAKEIGMGGGATADHLETTFKRELRSHLAEVTRMMASTSPPSIIGTQTIALQHFTSILPELSKIFSTVELVSIATSFANAVTVGKGKIVIWKLIMYLQIVKGFLFDNSESRPLLVEAVVIWIKPHFGRYDEYHTNESESVKDAARVSWLESIRLCVTIVAVMLDKLQQNLVNPAIVADRNAFRKEQDNVENLLPLIPRLLDSYREFQGAASRKAMDRTRSSLPVKTAVPVTFPESYPFSLVAQLPDGPRNPGTPGAPDADNIFNPGLGETATVFLVLILSSPTKHILNFLELSLDIEGRDRFVALLSQFFKVATSILENDAFPKTWLNINVLAHKVLIKIMEPIASIMEKEFIPPQEAQGQFNSHLWREGFYMFLKLLSSDQLVIEEFTPQKCRAVWRLAGDIRGDGASILLTLWQALGWAEHPTTTGEPATRYGGYQVYLHSLVGQVVNLCLSHHDQLRNNAVQMLYSMIVSEYHQSQHFDEIETELVTRLDSLFMSDSKGDDISRAFFIGHLRHLFYSSDVDESLRERVSIFLDSVDLFLELLLSVRALPEGDEYADDRVIATLRLMNFIRRIGRDEIYIKYVHQLVNMHLQSQNYVEAALTLKLHSDLHEWDLNSFVPPMEDLGLPQQSQFHRKETLCLLILDYLGKGKAWESAIDICKELAFQHSEVTFNYGRLSEILRHQAALLEHIVTDQRYYSDYYRVTFYGNFPAAIRDKRFIYRGYEWEKFGAFCERMLSKHPGAQLLKTPGEAPVDIRFGHDQYIQCTAVTPEPNRALPIFTNPDVPLPVRTYYEHSAINLFSSSRQIKKITRSGQEEIWLEKTYFTTEEAFPTVLRRSEVVGAEIVEISPVENALSEVELKTKELAALNLKYQALAKTAQPVSTNALAMCLNSAVDAPINTGVSAYRQSFFDPEYISRNPERAELVEKLKAAIDEQVVVIDHCMKLHGHLCPPEFIPFHETLEKFFKKNFRDEIRRLGLEASDPISPSLGPRQASQYPPSAYEQSVKQSLTSTVSTTRARVPFFIPPLQLGGPVTSPPPMSPRSPTSPPDAQPPAKQTPLQRHLAHLARHGINGVSSAPGDTGGSDSLSAESPHNSFVNVGNGVHAVPGAKMSGASVATSKSFTSFGSLKGRFSRFGSLNFGRRGATTS
ncbi:C2 domain in Dock180 and Zizimin proteins-domain-containing protein [Mycena alexandri]|uniref:C2 domain in Dock180 and Zizimin proteins-domain-containing protein n=1 Tax=Mycena alexandri TaxID=1745969 RepID=A0AAD6TG28_9AGAR|nr:C2 domain in Dock180 and Zizimin proteins-domain-containing protein [Mycena alexandri]